MFTGIVEEMGVTHVPSGQGAHSRGAGHQGARCVLEDTAPGRQHRGQRRLPHRHRPIGHGGFTADVMHETLNRSSLGALRPGQPCESGAGHGRQTAASAGTSCPDTSTAPAPSTRCARDDNAIWYTIAAGAGAAALHRGKRLHHHRRHQPDRGAVWTARAFPSPPSPTPLPSRSWRERKPGDMVNLETDIIGKYVEKLLRCPPGGSGPRAETVLRHHQRISHPATDFDHREEHPTMFQYNTIEEALEDLRQGRMILCTDDPDRENEGDLICAAEFATTENVNFMATHAKGLICMPMSAGILSGSSSSRRWSPATRITTRRPSPCPSTMWTPPPASPPPSASITAMKCVDRRRQAGGLPPPRPYVPPAGQARRRAGAQRPHRGHGGPDAVWRA